MRFICCSFCKSKHNKKTLVLEHRSACGGDGAISDGKLKTSLEFMTLFRRKLVSENVAIEIRKRMLRILDSTDTTYTSYPSASNKSELNKFYDQEQERIDASGIDFFEIRRETDPVLHIGTNNLRKYIHELIMRILSGSNVNIATNSSVLAVEQTANGFDVFTKKEEYHCEQLALCIGRQQTQRAWELADSLGVDNYADEALLGGRIEVPADSVWSGNGNVYAPSYRDFKDPLRTFSFCVCEHGKLTRSTNQFGEKKQMIVNGHTNPAALTDRTNWALLTEISPYEMGTPDIFVQKFADIVNQASPSRTISASLVDIVEDKENSVEQIFGQGGLNRKEIYIRLQRWLQKMATVFPRMLTKESTFTLPEIKIRGRRALVDSSLTALSQSKKIKGLLLGGDGLVTTNLFDAHCSGLVIGDTLANKPINI